ncbi:MAG: DUF1573 domain-containing protein [Spirosomataceae bacterium]
MKLLFTAFFACFTWAVARVQTGDPVMTFEVTAIDYGIIDKGANPIRKFKFTNTGNEPLIIKSAKPSCSCVKAIYPQAPLMPGESALVEANYDTQQLGNFIKTITITTNETESTHTLTIKGETKLP